MRSIRSALSSTSLCLVGQRRLPSPSVALAAATIGTRAIWSRDLHTALLAGGLGNAISALPHASKDKQGTITVPVPDPRLDLLAEMERTKPVPALMEVAEVEGSLLEELKTAVDKALAGAQQQPVELSGKLLATLKACDALVMAVPCLADPEASDPRKWLDTAESLLVKADLQALEQQLCIQGASGPDAKFDEAKLRKSVANSKDKAVSRSADELLRDVLLPGFSVLRAQLRAGVPARELREGLQPWDHSLRQESFGALDRRFEDLARGWLNQLVTWRPLLIVADVPESDAGAAARGSSNNGSTNFGANLPLGNEASSLLLAHTERRGLPCLTACVALESESAGLRDEPEFVQEYLESFGLRGGHTPDDTTSSLRPWTSQAASLVRQFPRLLNQLVYFTAGEKEARAWMCPRVRHDHSPLPFMLSDATSKTAAATQTASPPKGGKAAKASASAADNGVPAFLACRAIHSSFESRVKGVLLWKLADLEVLGPSATGPAVKERAKAEGKMRKLPAKHAIEEGDIVEFELN